MKLTDGLFHKVFNEIAKEYPQIQTDHHIIDIACAKLATRPEIFDVIVTLNLYGDIISDIVAEISGSVGLAGSANIGKDYAMFEAIHGSAPDIANQNIANPTGLIQASIMMLVHLKQYSPANLIFNALHKTIEDGIHTADIYNKNLSKKLVGTKEFGEMVIKNFGSKPQKLKSADYSNKEDLTKNHNNQQQLLTSVNNKLNLTENGSQENKIPDIKKDSLPSKSLIGFDLFIDWQDDFNNLLTKLKTLESEVFEIKMISAMGLVLWPLIDQHMIGNFNKGLTILRFIGKGITGKNSHDIIDPSKKISHLDIIYMLSMLEKNKFDFVKYEGLYLFDNLVGFTSGQGE
jgi:isocitrate dehydrogenase